MKLAISGPLRLVASAGTFSALLAALFVLPVTQALGQSSAQSVKERRLAAFQKRHAELRQEFVRRLADVAKYCDSVGLTTDASSIRKYARSLPQTVLRYSVLPGDAQPEIPRTLPETERQWRLKLRKAKGDYANALYTLAREVLNSGFSSDAYRLIRETAVVDPDHASARRMLGYVQEKGRWLTPFEKSKAEKGEVWHKKFGWLPKSHVARYEKGERYYVPSGGTRGNWIAAAVERQYRKDFNNCWQVRTEHFLVKTNHSLEQGVRVASKLEEFYRFFMHTFAGFFNSPKQISKLLPGTASSTRKKPYDVHYYKDKNEYVEKLKRKPYLSRVEITNGMYYLNERTAFFFHSDTADYTPIFYHEVTHQILYESLPKHRLIGLKRHFWIVEGISCYIESFRSKGGKFSLGDPNSLRFAVAKDRYVNDKFYIPLARFAQLGMQDWQSHREIVKVYAQASGLSKFFMDYDNGRYRDAFIEHIAQVYRTDGRRAGYVKSLAELTGVSYPELDRQYGEYISKLPVTIMLQ